MKLTYWLAQQHDDHECYDIVARTRKEAIAQMSESRREFEPPVKREIRYKDAFDLFEQLTGEGGGRRYGY